MLFSIIYRISFLTYQEKRLIHQPLLMEQVSWLKKSLLNSTITLNNGNQLYKINAGNDKILAYYIGYILFSNYTNPKGESYMLEQLQNIFPYLSKYGYKTIFVFGRYVKKTIISRI